MSESPGIHSRAMQARDGALQGEKDREMDDAVHGATGPLHGLFERIHGTGDMLFEGIGYEHVIVFGIAVIGARTRKVVDSINGVITAAGATGRISTCGCAAGPGRNRGSLLSGELHRSGYERCHRRDHAKETASSVD